MRSANEASSFPDCHHSRHVLPGPGSRDGSGEERLPWITVSKDKKGFVLDSSRRPFVPWGFNYDHDADGRLIEDYWDEEWPTVEAHFGQMKKLGANVVRVHLQLGKFMDARTRRIRRRWPGSTNCSSSPKRNASIST